MCITWLSRSTLVALVCMGLFSPLGRADDSAPSAAAPRDLPQLLPSTTAPLPGTPVAAQMTGQAPSQPTALQQLATVLSQNNATSEQVLQLLAQVGAPDSSGVAGGTYAPSSQAAQEARDSLLLDPLVGPIDKKLPQPGSTFGVPSAYGASWRNVFFGGGFVGSGEFTVPSSTGPKKLDVDPDGSLSFGAGFGNPIENVGFEVGIGIISLRDSFGDSGAIGFKFHKLFPEAGNLGIAAGWTNALDWGDANDAQETVYGVVTKPFDLRPGTANPLPLTVTAGLGTGSFRSTGAIDAGSNDPNFFGSVGLRVLPQLSLVNSWTGNQLNMGISAAPFQDIPFTLTLGAGDVTNNRGNGVRFLMNGGFGFSF